MVEETGCRASYCGCDIEEIAASGKGTWLVTQRISGQGEWGYDVFRVRPLAWEAGIPEEKGYLLALPRFSEDESFLAGGAGRGYMGGWWCHPEDEIEDSPRPGAAIVGFVFVHRLPSHQVTRHELRVILPSGWRPEDPWAEWYGPEIFPTSDGLRLMTWWGIPLEIKEPIPSVIELPVPHPSGKGLL
jgi:hypothetical protein